MNSSDSSDCEDHESVTLHHHHQELARMHHDRLAVGRPPPGHGSRGHSSERQQHDPFSNNSIAGSDVVDELLKPLQSYFSVFRTGVYDHGSHHGLLDGVDMVNGRDGPPAHNTRSHDKRYKIKKNQQDGRGKRPEPVVVENGMHHPGVVPMHHHPQAGMLPPNAGPPPVVTNGFTPAAQARLDNMETEISQLPGTPNLSEPPPNMVAPSSYPPPTRPLMLLPSMVGPPPPVMMSPPGNPVPTMYSTPVKDEAVLRQEQLEMDISNLSIRESEHVQVSPDFFWSMIFFKEKVTKGLYTRF